jgi:hypothetical protein
MSTDANRHHLFSIIALLSFKFGWLDELRAYRGSGVETPANQRMENLEAASEFGLYNRKSPSYQSSADITL